MQIALTKKLADAMDLKPAPSDDSISPLFTWTANWTNVYSNRKREDLLVLVNNATRFAVAIYQVKKKDLKKSREIITNGIHNSLMDLNLNPEMVAKYMAMAGEIDYSRNQNRAATAWVNRACLDSAFYIGNEYMGVAKMFSDTLGAPLNRFPVNYSKNKDDSFTPEEAMVAALANLTGEQPRRYKALEIRVSLDLEVYKATRTMIVPANLRLIQLHKVLQNVFDWKNYHLYDFTIYRGEESNPVTRLVPYQEDLEYDNEAILIGNHTLGEFLVDGNRIRYVYDFGDYWVHEIELLRVLENYDQDSPYLVEASGQTPPEDVGGLPGFMRFREIMMDPSDPDHQAMNDWAGYWNVELEQWKARPRKIKI